MDPEESFNKGKVSRKQTGLSRSETKRFSDLNFIQKLSKTRQSVQ
jgi:hypothetical protein